MIKSPIAKRSVVIGRRKSSVSLEDAFWDGLKEIAKKRRTTLSDLVGTIDAGRQQGNLSSALRLFVLEFYCGPDSPARARLSSTEKTASQRQDRFPDQP
jgi:predicted DNA-binding ribbon-helix-helix protein